MTEKLRFVSVGDAFRYMRFEKGYTQQRVANEIGVNVRTYRRWENNESPISIGRTIDILNLYGKKLKVEPIDEGRGMFIE